jgi:hypothetical protein
MKLVEFIKELEQKKEQLGNHSEKIAGGNGFILDSNALRNVEKNLFECDEFKNVVRINYIEMPNYLVDEDSGEPISSNREFLGGKTKVQETKEHTFNPEEEIRFNKIVDLYSIRLNKRYITKEEITKPGVWIYPTVYNQETFEATNQIRVIWDPHQLEQALALVGTKETPKERLMRMFETALDNMEPNTPCEYVLTIRCSSRSLASAGQRAPEEPSEGSSTFHTEIPPVK